MYKTDLHRWFMFSNNVADDRMKNRRSSEKKFSSTKFEFFVLFRRESEFVKIESCCADKKTDRLTVRVSYISFETHSRQNRNVKEKKEREKEVCDLQKSHWYLDVYTFYQFPLFPCCFARPPTLLCWDQVHLFTTDVTQVILTWKSFHPNVLAQNIAFIMW